MQDMEGPMKAQDMDTSSSCSHGAVGAKVSNSGTSTRAVRGRGLHEKTSELLALVSITLAEMTTETARGFRLEEVCCLGLEVQTARVLHWEPGDCLSTSAPDLLMWPEVSPPCLLPRPGSLAVAAIYGPVQL